MEFIKLVFTSIAVLFGSLFGGGHSTSAPPPTLLSDQETTVIEQRIRDELSTERDRVGPGPAKQSQVTPVPVDPTQPDPPVCNSPSVSDERDIKKLSQIEAEIQSLNNRLSSISDTNVDASLRLQIQREDLLSQYDQLTASITKQQVGTVSASMQSSIYKAYCGTSTRIAGVDGLPAQSFNETLSKTDFNTLTCNLSKKTYQGAQVPVALYYMGFKLFQADRFDDSFAFYSCAAHTYFHLTAIYRVAQVYLYGSDDLREDNASLVIKKPILQDKKKAYFWIAVLFHTESAQNTGMLDTATTMGWNSVGMLDTLQQDQTLSDNDLLQIEQEARAFVGKKYPSVLSSKSSLYNHSMRAMIPALEQATAR
ncbi:hypothetical protein FJY93_00315 [Candidatus Kaiserbacteria bacterium]|nr:hypothetical protein [Candidatus Kaiserbacteria bacterium]